MCSCCTAAQESPDYRWFDPACLWCGARYIRRMNRFEPRPDECKERRQQVLSDWMAHGHAEADLRAWAKSAQCFAPGPEPASESAPLTKTKRR